MLCQFTLLLLTAVAADSWDHDLQYVAALRKSQFYRLSELQAEQLLSKADLTPHQQSQVVVEISKTLAAQALNSRPPNRETFWTRATEILAEASRSQSDPAIQLMLQAQQAFVYEQQSAWTVREAELRSTTDDDWHTARTQLRRAIRSLQQVEDTFSSPELRRQSSLPDTQLQSIKRNIQFQLGSAYLHQAITYNASPRDQTNALTQAMDYFRPLAASRLLDDITWKSRISLVRCIRMLGQFDQAQKLLQNWSSAPAERIGAIAAESIRLALDARQLEAALQLASTQSIDSNDPEFQLARIEALVAASEQLKGQPVAKSYQQQASLAASNLGKAHGTYWALRGELLLARLAQGANADASMLRTAAETMLRKDAPESAKQLFLQAAEQANQQGDQAFEFLYKAAVVDHREDHLQPAIDQLRDVAMRYPQHQQAAEAHLLAVFDAAGLFQQYAAENKTKLGDALAQYEELLREHLQTWPESPTSNQARIWDAKLALAHRQWLAAIERYQAVTVDSEYEVPAYRGLALALSQWIAATHPPALEIQKQRDWMQARLRDVNSKLARATLAIEAAKLAMSGPFDYALATSLLQEAWQATLKDSEITQEIGLLLVVAATGARQTDLARDVFIKIVPLPPESLMQILRGLEPMRQNRRDDAALRTTTLELIELLTPFEDRISAADRSTVRRAAADYLPIEQAVLQYKAFAAEEPKDFAIQKRYAELLSKLNHRNSRQLTLQQWRRVAQLAKQQTPAWFQAKLAVAQAHYELGDRKNTRDLIEYLAALYPELGGPELKRQFEQLLHQVKQ